MPTKLHFEKSGPETSEQVLLLHGWGSSAELMRPLARLLEDRFFIVNVDLPGHGQTPPPELGWGVPEYAEGVARLLLGRYLLAFELISIVLLVAIIGALAIGKGEWKLPWK